MEAVRSLVSTQQVILKKEETPLPLKDQLASFFTIQRRTMRTSVKKKLLLLN
jgi:hypothetical protein